jgi:hypothetical protein
LGPGNSFDRWVFPFERLKFAIKRGENIPREARSDSPDVLELPILESTKEECAKIFPRTRRRGITQNDEFVFLVHLYFKPLAAAPFDIHRRQSLRDHALVSSLFGDPKGCKAIGREPSGQYQLITLINRPLEFRAPN